MNRSITVMLAAVAALVLLPLSSGLQAPSPALGGAPRGGPPSGLGELDAWVDAAGDTMFGDLEMGFNAVGFNGTPLAAAPGGGLVYGGQSICLDSGDGCPPPGQGFDPVVRVRAIHSMGFGPSSSASAWVHFGGWIQVPTGSFGSFVAPLELPDGARLLSATFYVRDNDATASHNMQLFRTDFQTLQSAVLGQVVTDQLGTPGDVAVTVTVPPLFDDPVQDGRYAYALADGFGSGLDGANMRLYGATYAYELGGPLP